MRGQVRLKLAHKGKKVEAAPLASGEEGKAGGREGHLRQGLFAGSTAASCDLYRYALSLNYAGQRR